MIDARVNKEIDNILILINQPTIIDEILRVNGIDGGMSLYKSIETLIEIENE